MEKNCCVQLNQIKASPKQHHHKACSPVYKKKEHENFIGCMPHRIFQLEMLTALL